MLIQKSNETVVNVINDNTYVPGVLYLDDSNSAVDTTKDGVSLFGGLVRWLWKNVFDGAFDAADITKLDGLFYDPAAVAEEVPDGSLICIRSCTSCALSLPLCPWAYRSV